MKLQKKQEKQRKNNLDPSRTDPKRFTAKLRRILMLSFKEIEILLNDKMAVLLLVIFPLSIVLLTNFGGFAANNTDGNGANGDMPLELRFSIPIIGIIDADNSEGFGNADLSYEFVKIFKDFETDGECIIKEGYSRNKLEEMIGNGEINAYIIVDDGFEYNLSIHMVGMFTVVINSYDSFVLQDVVGVIDDVIANFQDKFDFHGAINLKTSSVNFSQKGQYLKQVTPFFFPLIGFAMTLLIETQSFVSDIPKDRMILTPAKKGEIVLSKFFGGITVNSIVAVILVFLPLLLGMEIQNSIFIFFLVFESAVIIATTVGLFFSSISNTTLAGFQYALVIIIVQEILMLFISNDIFLSMFPLYAVQEIYRLSVIRGIPLLLTTNMLGIPYILIMWTESIISLLFTYIIFKKKRSVI
ncbi:ABC transporter permease [Candidatus Harpocratesius sp.]